MFTLFKSFRLTNVVSMLFLLIGFRVFYYHHFVQVGLANFNHNTIEFTLFVLSIGLITSAGYLVNDILDQKTDAINHPQKQLAFSNKKLWLLYFFINTLAILIIFALTISSTVRWILLLAIVLLFMYSYFFQKLPLIGNISIAFLAGLLPILYYYYDATTSPLLLQTVYLYAGIAFGITLLRELIKDKQDKQGDKIAGYKTIPILLSSRWFMVFFFGLSICFMIGYYWLIRVYSITIITQHKIWYLTYILFFLALFFTSKNKIDLASLCLKLVLFTGVLLLYFL